MRRIIIISAMAVPWLMSCGGQSEGTLFQENLASTQTVQLKPLTANDIAVQEVDPSYEAAMLPSINKTQDEINFAQVLEESALISSQQKGFTQYSRSFKREVNATALTKGVVLPLTSTQAIIRVTPESGRAQDAVKPEQIQLIQKGVQYSGKAAFESFVDSDALAAAGIGNVNTSTIQTSSALKPGPVIFRAENLKKNNLRYFVHVFEPNSDKELVATISKVHALEGADITSSFKLLGTETTPIVKSAQGYLVSPDKFRKIPLNLTVHDDSISTNIATKGLHSNTQGLWELHASMEHEVDGMSVVRDIKLAVAISPKTATLNEQVTLNTQPNDDGFALTFEVQTYLPGRYEVNGIVYGLNEKGEMQPGVQITTAKWLEGSNTITLHVASDLLAESMLNPPYELRHLRLRDQTRMAELWVQEYALDIPLSEG